MKHRLELPEVQEIEGRDAFEILVEHFGWEDQPTLPMALDDLPAQPTLVETEVEVARRKLGPRHNRKKGKRR